MSTCSSSRPRIQTFLILFIFSSLVFLPLSEPLQFKFTSFAADAKNIIYSGDAVSSAGTIEFNRVDFAVRVGHAKYSHAVQMWDKKTGMLSDFTTRFSFIIDTLSKSTYGDALSFFLAPVGFQIPINSAGEFLGMYNTTDTPQNLMIHVEFDSAPNRWDPPVGHVGININSLRSANYTAWNASLHSGEPADATVSYNATTQMLSVSWSYGAETQTSSQGNTSLSYQVDLREVLPEQVTVGFSAATGTLIERHILRSWEFSSSLKTVEKSEGTSKGRKLIIGLTVPIGVLVVGVIAACAIFRSRQRKPIQQSLDTVALTSINEDLERGAGPKRFSFSDLALATNNFSDDRKLGEGGFGCVYKGHLYREGLAVAVKKISQDSKQGKKEYITEVKIISSLRHRNLVQLIGWCHDQTQFLLVYELLPNGSLDSHLFGKKRPLEWAVRYKIATGVASALLYLHEECEQCVLHRDVKASNIMLDSGFNAKLGDFGLARFMDHESGLQTTGLAGTLGYMSPEYITTGKASKESDVYSFGVVALEMASGRKAMDRIDEKCNLGLVQWVWDLLGKGELVSGVDQKLGKEFEEEEAKCLMMVGLWCAHPDWSLRPSIRQAIQALKFEGAIPNLPTKMPVAMYYAGPDVSYASATMSSSSLDLVR